MVEAVRDNGEEALVGQWRESSLCDGRGRLYNLGSWHRPQLLETLRVILADSTEAEERLVFFFLLRKGPGANRGCCARLENDSVEECNVGAQVKAKRGTTSALSEGGNSVDVSTEA